MRAKKRLCCSVAEPICRTESATKAIESANLVPIRVELSAKQRRFPDVSNETQSALQLLRSIFPTDKFPPGFPPIAMKHQLYAMVPSRPDVEKALDMLTERGEIRTFRLGPQEADLALVSSDDFVSYVRQRCALSPIVEKFLECTASPRCGLCYSHTFLSQDNGFQESDISKLVKLGLLVARDAGQWWAGIPGSSVFTHALARGRAALLLTLRRAKRHELPRAEVESSKMPRGAKLGVSYYVYDALGASLVVCARTTAGDVLRLRE